MTNEPYGSQLAEIYDAIVRMGFSSCDGRTSKLHMHYLVGDTGAGVQRFQDEHTMTLFTAQEYEQALGSAGLIGIQWVDSWAEGRDRILASRAQALA